MGSLKQDFLPVKGKGSIPIFIKSDLSKNGKLNGKSEVQNGKLANGLLKDEPEMEPLLLKAKPKVEDLKLFNKKLDAHLGKILSEMPVVMKDERLEDRIKFLELSIKRFKNKDDFPQIYDIGSSLAELKGIFAVPNLTEEMEETPKEFKIHVDCQQFSHKEIKVVVKGGSLSVHCSHQMKRDDHGFVQREFKRSWPIPENVKQEEFVALLDRYGILTLRAPREGSIVIPVYEEEDPQ